MKVLFALLFFSPAVYAGGPGTPLRSDTMLIYAGFIALMLAIVGAGKLAELVRTWLKNRHIRTQSHDHPAI